jgi:hypothetical protein
MSRVLLRHHLKPLLPVIIAMHTLSPTIAAAVESTGAAPVPAEHGVSTAHDFDFLVGRWMVQHRRLKRRLAHSNEWETFSGTCEARMILDGQANLDDNVLELPGHAYRAATLRAFDPSTETWSIWWLDARHPHQLDPPVVGSFRDGVGAFFANDVWNGRSIIVRFIWSDITANSARWQQSFSEDAGKSWETNWVMDFKRAAPSARKVDNATER